MRGKKIAIEKAKAKEKQWQKEEVERILRRGVYCGLSGPTYETPGEIR